VGLKGRRIWGAVQEGCSDDASRGLPILPVPSLIIESCTPARRATCHPPSCCLLKESFVTTPFVPSLSDAAGPPTDPLLTFETWLARAEAESGMQYPNAMTLVTLREDGQPDGRIVLLKGFDARGFQFYTNYTSAKGRALDAHPEAALVFYWDALGLQVRVRGRAERLAESESDDYFNSRPRDSRVGAWASSQSQPIDSRAALEAEVARQAERFGEDGPVPRPPHWGGFLLVPLEIELWEEGAWRLHNRFLYRRSAAAAPWEVQRLQP